jgi:hypothetical protein
MKIIYNPFEKFSENRLLITGILLTLAGSALAWQLSARYDGAIDMHLGSNVQWWQPLIDNAVNTASLAGLLFALGYYFNNRTRFIDVLNAALIARSPFYLLPLSNLGGFMARATENILAAGPDITKIALTNLIVLVIVGFLSIGILVWAMALLYNGFKVATNIKTKSQIIAFTVTILLAEVLSKILTLNLPY